MNANLVILNIILLKLISRSNQQDIIVCPIGYDYDGKNCVQQEGQLSKCPDNYDMVNGTCQLKHATVSCGSGFRLINGVCVKKGCPDNYAEVNGVCQLNTTNYIPTYYCPPGYTLYNGMCYFKIPPLPTPCQMNQCGIFNCPSGCVPPTSTTTTTTSKPPVKLTTTTTTTTTARPPPRTTPQPSEIMRCPPDTKLIGKECRLIYCPRGTVHNGRCLEPVCAHGLVWTGRKCDKPEIITTILEIENTFFTEVNKTGPDFHNSETVNRVEYHTEPYDTYTEEVPIPTIVPTSETSLTTTTSAPPIGESKNCCIVVTPRICKQYDNKWICFNRRYRRCDEVCANNSVVYLRIPKVVERPSVMVVPPNPPLSPCSDNDCNSEDEVNCSGCGRGDKGTCSPYCYRYRCPENRCMFMEQSDYCIKYPGTVGCKQFDGCYGEWCS